MCLLTEVHNTIYGTGKKAVLIAKENYMNLMMQETEKNVKLYHAVSLTKYRRGKLYKTNDPVYSTKKLQYNI